MKIKKAIIAAAGFGTRMLPATKAVPKEMLPIIDKPVIQYIVEEIVQAGITDIVIVTGYHKRAIEDHFDHSFELEKWLEQNNKIAELEAIKKIADMANLTFIRQKNGYGNAVPLLSAKHILEDDPFLLLWGDIIALDGRAKRVVEAFDIHQKSVLCATKKSSQDDFMRYGYIKGKKIEDNLYKIDSIIEKPGTSPDPSNLAVMNGYTFTATIWDYLDQIQPNASGELCLIDAIDLQAHNEDVLAIDISDIPQYDTGNKEEFLDTTIKIALTQNKLGKKTIDFIKEHI